MKRILNVRDKLAEVIIAAVGFFFFTFVCWATTAAAAQNILVISSAPFAVSSSGNVDVRYYLSTADSVYAAVYDGLGTKVADLITGTTYQPGIRNVRWSNPNPGANGFYEIRLWTSQSTLDVSGEVYFDDTDPSISVTVSSTAFNPLENQMFQADYVLSENARVTAKIVEMKDPTTIVGTTVILATNLCQAGGAVHTVCWDGRNSGGQYVPNGLYALQLIVTDIAGNKYVNGTNEYYLSPVITLDKDNGASIVTCASPTPYFAPVASGQKPHRLTFTLNEKPQDVAVSVYDSSGWVTDVVYGATNFRLGSNYIAWDGTAGGSLVPSGVYYYVVRGRDIVDNSFSATSASFRVDTVSASITGNPATLNLTIKNANGYNYVDIPFNLSKPCRVTVQILNSSGQVVSSLLTGAVRCGSVSVGWDGQNSSRKFVPAGTYSYRILATDLNGTAVTPAQGTINVN